MFYILLKDKNLLKMKKPIEYIEFDTKLFITTSLLTIVQPSWHKCFIVLLMCKILNILQVLEFSDIGNECMAV